jgi:hypothetical protein
MKKLDQFDTIPGPGPRRSAAGNTAPIRRAPSDRGRSMAACGASRMAGMCLALVPAAEIPHALQETENDEEDAE